MSYEPTNWKDGDLVTSAKLNKLEQGVAAGGGITFVGAQQEPSSTQPVLDKTWQEIYNAATSGMVYLKVIQEESESVPTRKSGVTYFFKSISLMPLQHIMGTNSTINYQLSFIGYNNTPMLFIASSPDDYPVYTEVDSDEEDDDPNPSNPGR